MGLKIRRSRALCNLVLALSSYDWCGSVTDLSVSPLFHYQYSIITKAVSDLSRSDADFKSVQKQIQSHCVSQFGGLGRSCPVLLQTDSSPFVKAHSPTLPDRGYVAIPNVVIRGNKPIDIGYDVSFINFSDPQSQWSLPLSIERVGLEETASDRALSQLKQLLSHPELGLSEHLCVNTVDSKYGNAAFLADAFGHDNLVHLTRFRSGMKVWLFAPKKGTQGAPQIYGEQFYLHSQTQHKTYKKHPQTGQPYQVHQRSIFEHPSDHDDQIKAYTRAGRELQVQIWRWNNLLMRSKKGKNMKDKPLDLLAIRVLDAKTQKRVFEKDIFVAIHGKRKDEISTQNGYLYYRKRYDIEPALRFGKQRLFLDKFQTPDIEHFDNWFFVYQLAVWLLFYARDEVCFIPRKWRKYLSENKDSEKPLSIAQTRHAAQNLFLTFDQTPFLPLKSKKGRPRRKGEIQTPRKHYKPQRKKRKTG